LPSQNYIKGLHKDRKTKCSFHAYVNHFGEGSFVRARENLEEIIKAQESKSKEKDDSSKETQIFP